MKLRLSLYLKQIETLTVVKGSVTLSGTRPGDHQDLLIDGQEQFGPLRIEQHRYGRFKVSGLQQSPNLYRLRLNCCPSDLDVHYGSPDRPICLVLEETHEFYDRSIKIEHLIAEQGVLDWHNSSIEIEAAFSRLDSIRFMKNTNASEHRTLDVVDFIANELEFREESSVEEGEDLDERIDRVKSLTIETAISCEGLVTVLDFFKQLETLHVNVRTDCMGNAEASDSLVTYLRSTPLKLKHVNISGGDIEWLVHFRQCETVHLTCFGEVLEDVLLREHDLLDPRAQKPSELQSLGLDLRHPKDYFDPYIFIDFIKRQINESTEVSISGVGMLRDSPGSWVAKILGGEDVMLKEREFKRNISSNP